MKRNVKAHNKRNLNSLYHTSMLIFLIIIGIGYMSVESLYEFISNNIRQSQEISVYETNIKDRLNEEVGKAVQIADFYYLHNKDSVPSGAERGMSKTFGGAYPVEIIAHTLRMFGQGTKVCVEVAIMALDAGLIPYGEPIIAIGGTGQGADTAVIITPSHASGIFETKIHEIICKPSCYK